MRRVTWWIGAIVAVLCLAGLLRTGVGIVVVALVVVALALWWSLAADKQAIGGKISTWLPGGAGRTPGSHATTLKISQAKESGSGVSDSGGSRTL